MPKTPVIPKGSAPPRADGTGSASGPDHVRLRGLAGRDAALAPGMVSQERKTA